MKAFKGGFLLKNNFIVSVLYDIDLDINIKD